MEVEHVPHKGSEDPVSARLVETELQVLGVQIQVRLGRRQAKQDLFVGVVRKLNSTGAKYQWVGK